MPTNSIKGQQEAALIYNFMIEADIRCYEGINEEEE